MLGAFQIMFSGVWSVLSIPLPLSDNISFNLWQFFLVMSLIGVILRQLFVVATSGGGKD